MKLRQLFENSNSQFLQTKKEVEEWLILYNIRNYTIREDLTVDVDGEVDISRERLKFFPVRFGYVDGSFMCGVNELTSLKGSPREVNGQFWCGMNPLTSLVGAPREVGESFDCSSCDLKTLEGAPKNVYGSFDCSSNQLVSLKGSPKEIYADFLCYSNALTNLEGGPEEVAGDFACFTNQLTSLNGAPQKIGGTFECVGNPKLKSLDGLGEVHGRIYSDLDPINESKDEDRKKEIYSRWRKLINMTAAEVENFKTKQLELAKKSDKLYPGLKPKEARKIGISSGVQSAEWIIKMKNTSVKDWTPEMWKWANKQISFVSRMSGNKGPLYDDKGNPTRKLLSLKIWGHNPSKGK